MEGGLTERGAYFKFWLRGEGPIREGSLIELLWYMPLRSWVDDNDDDDLEMYLLFYFCYFFIKGIRYQA